MSRHRRPRLARLAVVVLAGLLGGCAERGADPAEREPAPELNAVTLDGEAVSLSSLRGQPVLVNVWATWCAPCRQEIPELQALHEEYGGRGLRVVGVTVDHRAADAEVRRFVAEFGMTYDVWWDPDQTFLSGLGAMGVPITVLVDRDGTIAWRHLGVLERENPEMLEAVKAALESPAPVS